jgi:hypothetical protein
MDGPHTDLRLADGVTRGAPFRFSFEGRELPAFPGETVAAALLAAGVRALRHGEGGGAGRGLFCGMGACFECRMVIDGLPNRRACMTPAAPGMRVARNPAPGAP